MSEQKTVNRDELLTILDAALTEKEWAAEVKAYAKEHGWLVSHVRPSWARDNRTIAGIRWVSATEGDVGVPDWVFARANSSGCGTVILAELKTEKGRFRPGQEDWIRESGGYCWRPSDRQAMWEVLK